MNRFRTALPFLLGFGLFITAFITYLITLCPSNYFGDSGELITAIITLGVPHPTGFPVYILSGKVFSMLPLASPAFRVNLMSAFFGALVPVFIFLAARFFSKKENDSFTSLYLPFAAAALFIFSYTLWSQAVIARIYSLNAFFCAFALALFLYYTEIKPSKKALYMLAFITGLGAGIHLSFVTFTGILWIYLLIKHPKTLIGNLVPLAALALTGASIYLYISIRGNSAAVLKWHELNTLNDLKIYFSQAQYKAKMFTRNAHGYSLFFGFIKSVIIRELSGLGLILFLAGAAWSVQKNFRYFWPFLLIFVSNILTLAVYGNYTDMHISFRYMIPSYIIAVFFIFLFCSYLYTAIKNRKAAAVSALACLVFILLSCFPVNRYENDRSENFTAYNYPFDLLSPLPEKSYFFTSGDNQIYTLAYAKLIQGRFPGVTIYDQVDTIFRNVRELWKDGNMSSMTSDIISAFTKNITPIYSTSIPGNPAIGSSAAGLGYRLYDGPAGPGILSPWQLFSLKGIIRDSGSFHAFEEREVVGSYYFRLAQVYLKAGKIKLYTYLLDRAESTAYDSASALGNIAITWSSDFSTEGAAKKADELFSKALLIDPQNDMICFNAGSFYARVGDWEKSARMFTKTVELNPGNMMARIYLARVQQELDKKNSYETLQKEQSVHYTKAKEYFDRKDYDMAMIEFNKDIEANPKYDRSYFHMGLIYSLRNELGKAIPFYEKTVEANNTNFSALNNLGLCYLKLNKRAKAKEYFLKSLAINPGQDRIKKLNDQLK
jgi:Tfp pilus assembly protein PilF